MRHAEFLGERAAAGVEVDADDHVGADQSAALDDVEPDAAEAEHDDLGAGLDLGGVDHRADAGGDAAADVADLVERRVLADLGDRDLRQHREIGEGRGAHVVVDRLAAAARSGWCRRASRPWPCVARIAVHRLVLPREAGFALPAFGRVERDDVIALFELADARPDIDDDAGALMAEDRRKQPLGIGARQRVFVGVADAGGLDLDQHLAGARTVEIDGFQGQLLARFVGDRGTHLHPASPSRDGIAIVDRGADD